MMDFACSSFTWKTLDNKHLLGRTYDQFGDLGENSILFVPKNFNFSLLIEENYMVSTKYCFVGMGINNINTPLLVDGINENGLMGALLRYPEFAKYDTNKSKGININPGFLITYILGKCKDLEEVCSEIKNINLSNEKVFGKIIPVHYIFSDRSGETIIIEPDDNGIVIHRNSIGVLTNSPNYKWHEQNLRNYVDLNPVLKSKQEICGKEFKDFGFSGLKLPGGYSSVNRFVKIALLKQFAIRGKNEIDGITKMFHNFSSVDIPAGIVCMETDLGYDYQMTLCMSAMCSESLIYYFNLSNNRRICAVDLKKELKNSELKNIKLPNNQDILYLN